MEAAANGAVVLQETVQNPEQATEFLIFGYGSLCWHPGFPFHRAYSGYIKGYSRRFFQGNTKHRGTDDQPGRVATLVEDDKGMVFGIAFAPTTDTALSYLAKRECESGGYISQFVSFYPRQGGSPLKVLVYIATPKNKHWLGEAPITDMAFQISKSLGPSGHNAEYVIRLADVMREIFPGETDEHLFNLEDLVKKFINEEKKCLMTVMGDGSNCIKYQKAQVLEPRLNNNNEDLAHEERVNTYQFATRVPKKNLRCLKK